MIEREHVKTKDGEPVCLEWIAEEKFGRTWWTLAVETLDGDFEHVCGPHPAHGICWN